MQETVRLHREGLQALQLLLTQVKLPSLAPGASDSDYAKFFTVISGTQILNSGLAVQSLQESGLGYPSLAFVRMQFEVVIRTAFVIHINQRKARHFFLSEPFEKLLLARQYGVPEQVGLDTLEANSVATLNDYPELTQVRLQTPNSIGNRELKRILSELRFPDVAAMIEALREQHEGWVNALYVSIFRMASQYIHQTILDVDRFFDRNSSTLIFQPVAVNETRVDFMLQSLSYVNGISAYIEQLFYGEVSAETSDRCSRQREQGDLNS